MKMLLGSALTLALVLPSGPASAELLKNLKTTGSVDLQMVSSRNIGDLRTQQNANGGGAVGAFGAYTGNDLLGTSQTRVIAGLSWDLLDDVHAKVSLRKNDRTWGTTGSAGQGAAGSQALGHRDTAGTATNGVLGNTFVNEAWVKVDKLFGHLDTTLGRQFWGEPGDLVAFWGPKNVYGLFVTAIDAAAVSASNDWMNFQGIAGKTAGSAVGVVAGADVDVRGIDVAWKMLPVKVNTFVWNQVTHAGAALGTAPGAATAGGLNDNLWLYGAKVKGEAMGGWFSGTVALNAGTNRNNATAATGLPAASANYIGKAILLDAGYKMDVADIGGFTPWATWGWGSGRHNTGSRHNENFTTIASDFRPGVMYGRFNSVSSYNLGNAIGGGITTYDGVGGVAAPGLTNRIIWGGGLKFNCARHQKSTLGVSYWDFNYQRATQVGATPATAVGNRHIGSELDVQLDWAHSENVMLSGGWATFAPGGFIKESVRAASGGAGVGVNPATMLFADVSVKF
ncbi:MAG: hypothetical protein HY925_01360 [Elusimicrobia bacterium]|nr:hypothetical protein [Elusimicrobiota bacterium]